MTEKLKVEREQTKQLNTEILSLKMKYNELDSELQASQIGWGRERQGLEIRAEGLKGEVEVLEKAMEEQKTSFE